MRVPQLLDLRHAAEQRIHLSSTLRHGLVGAGEALEQWVNHILRHGGTAVDMEIDLFKSWFEAVPTILETQKFLLNVQKSISEVGVSGGEQSEEDGLGEMAFRARSENSIIVNLF